jgi:hypothetical protein
MRGKCTSIPSLNYFSCPNIKNGTEAALDGITLVLVDFLIQSVSARIRISSSCLVCLCGTQLAIFYRIKEIYYSILSRVQLSFFP